MEETPGPLESKLEDRLRERERKYRVAAVGGERGGSALGGEQQGG